MIGKQQAVPMGPAEGNFGGMLICLKNANTPVCIFVQEWLPEMPVLLSVFPGGEIVHQLESLILAQNERWRHA
jgi:hypothetical protein